MNSRARDLKWALVGIAFSFFSSSYVFALAAPLHAAPPTEALGIAGDMGLGGLNGKTHATVQSSLDIWQGNLTLGFLGRVRFPLEHTPNETYVRRRDWDEVTDFIHILRSIRYSRSLATMQLHAEEGEMLGFSLGHGTLVRDYSNVADPDHPHSGLRLHLEGERLDFDSMVDNFVRPSVLAFRLAGKPAAALPGFKLGMSLVIDPRAPLQVKQGPSGERLIDAAYNLQVETKPLTLMGMDVEYAIGSREKGQLIPYSDFNTSFYGIGFHGGVMSSIPLGRTASTFGLQVEYRASSAGYSPAHIETFYDIERYQARLSLSPSDRANLEDFTPKLNGLNKGLYEGQGVLAQTSLHFRQLIQLKAGFSHRSGPDANTLWLRSAMKPLARLDLGFLLVLRGLSEQGSGKNGIMALAEGRYRLADYLYMLAQYTRTWSLIDDARFFGILQSFNMSIGANWSG